MKKSVLFSAVLLGSCLTYVSAQAQDPIYFEEVVVSTDTLPSESSIDDIINVQQQLTSNDSQEKHNQKVWSKRGYFNLSYNISSLSPKEKNYPTGVPSINNGYIPEFKSDWGVNLTKGHNYKILRNPIANILMINIDYNPLELTVNHYKAEAEKGLYNSDERDGDKFYYPWNLQKYQFSYGMTLGPSVTLAPFTPLGIKQLDFLKFNVYYHIGYQVSLIYSPNNKDAGADLGSTYSDALEKSLKLQFGHGLINAVGLNVSWKAIGIGYEFSTTPFTYFSINKEDFNNTKYKFKNTSNRIYLEIRM